MIRSRSERDPTYRDRSTGCCGAGPQPEGLTIVSRDAAIVRYEVPVVTA
jgi:hypothetical protein